MKRISLIISASLIVFTNSSFALELSDNPSDQIEVTQYNYYDTTPTRTRSMDDYQIANQYRGPMKNKGKIEKARLYIEAGLRGNKPLETKIEESGQRTISSVTDSLESTDIEADNGYGAALKLGYDDTNNNRYDFEIAYEHNTLGEWNFNDAFGSDLSEIKFEDSEISAVSFDINYYRDFFVESRVSPYLGIGIGMSSVKIKSGDGKTNGAVVEGANLGTGSDQVINYQLGFGARVSIKENHKVNVGYRYRAGFDELEIPTEDKITGEPSNPHTIEYGTHIAEISYQYLFDTL